APPVVAAGRRPCAASAVLRHVTQRRPASGRRSTGPPPSRVAIRWCEGKHHRAVTARPAPRLLDRSGAAARTVRRWCPAPHPDAPPFAGRELYVRVPVRGCARGSTAPWRPSHAVTGRPAAVADAIGWRRAD